MVASTKAPEELSSSPTTVVTTATTATTTTPPPPPPVESPTPAKQSVFLTQPEEESESRSTSVMAAAVSHRGQRYLPAYVGVSCRF